MNKIIVSIATTALLINSTQAISEVKWTEVDNGTWKVSDRQFDFITRNLNAYLLGESEKTGNSVLNFEEYEFQYQGQEDKQGRFIFINGFCEKPNEFEPKTEILNILDGGNCYFSVRWSPTNNQFYELFINGEA